MTYTTPSGVQIPQGTDAFNPPAQFKTWADGDDAFNNCLNVNLDSDRTALAAPTLRDGILCWVRSTKTLWSYQAGWTVVWSDSGWIPFPFASGWSDFTPTSWGSVAYRKVGSRVTLRGVPTSSSGFLLIGTLPAGFRPLFGAQFVMLLSTGPSQITVGADGAISLSSWPGGTVTVSWGHLTFLVD